MRFHCVSKVSKLTSLRGCKSILFHAFYVSINIGNRHLPGKTPGAGIVTSVVELGHYVGGAGGLKKIIVKLKKSRYNLVAKKALESFVLCLNIT